MKNGEQGTRQRSEGTYEIRLRIRSGTSSPLPTTIISSQVPINETLHEVFLSKSYSSAQYLDQAKCGRKGNGLTPIKHKILDKETSSNHPDSILHPSPDFTSPHGSVYDRITRFTIFP